MKNIKRVGERHMSCRAAVVCLTKIVVRVAMTQVLWNWTPRETVSGEESLSIYKTLLSSSDGAQVTSLSCAPSRTILTVLKSEVPFEICIKGILVLDECFFLA